MKKILIDNGHGEETAGKRSPDGRLREYLYCRDIAREVVRRLVAEGYDAELLVPESRDVSLTERARRVNEWCARLGAANVMLVSVHVNAAPPCDGKWHPARGWSAWTSRGRTKGDALADALYDAAEATLPEGIRIRTDLSDGDRDWEAGFAILTRTRCAACLTENLFQDNREDVGWLLSAEGREAIVRLHVDGIRRYCTGN